MADGHSQTPRDAANGSLSDGRRAAGIARAGSWSNWLVACRLGPTPLLGPPCRAARRVPKRRAMSGHERPDSCWHRLRRRGTSSRNWQVSRLCGMRCPGSEPVRPDRRSLLEESRLASIPANGGESALAFHKACRASRLPTRPRIGPTPISDRPHACRI